MSKVICIMGESGSGKTTSMRNLNPSETFYIDCDGKGLSWKGWRNQYNKEKKNYSSTDNPESVQNILRKINSEQLQFKCVVVDTLNGIMIGDEMRRASERGYDKWQDLAQSVFNLVNNANRYREDLTVIFVAHTQTELEDSGYMFTRIKTNGKKLNKICLESKFTTVLLAKNTGEKYIFETQSKNSTAKSPMGAFGSFEIDNDIVQVIKALEEF